MKVLFLMRIDTPPLWVVHQRLYPIKWNCGCLDYISSAGLRVLLIMHKACKGGVSLHGENEVVSEILSQTGFDSIFH